MQILYLQDLNWGTFLMTYFSLTAVYTDIAKSSEKSSRDKFDLWYTESQAKFAGVHALQIAHHWQSSCG